MRFIDEVEIKVRAGKGGNGAVSFHRAPFAPKGGPDGGDGGSGGNVIIQTSIQLSTLEEAAMRRTYRAENGRPGERNKRSGRTGKDILLKVPLGTVVRDAEDNAILVDMTKDKQEFVVARGGRGGRGNARFATSRDRAPRRCEAGQPGEERSVKLELKLLADAGLIGRPNAGKSTLLAALSRAKPLIAEFPFSTLSPALGVVHYRVYQRFVIADIPGLMEGARDGRGLGHQFLRHIERTRLLVFLIEATEPDYQKAYDQLVGELEGFSDEFNQLPAVVVMSKSDLLNSAGNSYSFPFDLILSSVTGEGLPELIDLIADRLGIKGEVQG